jgi:hypothetical protein
MGMCNYVCTFVSGFGNRVWFISHAFESGEVNLALQQSAAENPTLVVLKSY